MEKNQIKLLNKIQQASIELAQDGDLKKEGKGFRHSYFRTEDIIPKILQICYKYKMMYKPILEEGKMEMVDLEEPHGCLEYTLPVEVKKVTDDTEKNVQLVGKKQTYYERYLLIQIFSICETDEIELINPDKVHQKKRTPPMRTNTKRVSPLTDDEFQEMLNVIKRNTHNKSVDEVVDVLYDMGKFNLDDKVKLVSFISEGGVII